jgi:drug/metabolite transporter (DMT)-like permease
LAAVTSPLADAHRRGQLFVGFAAIAWSIAGVLQRGFKANVPTQLAGRAIVAFVALAVVVAYEARRANVQVASFVRAIGKLGILMAVLLSAASGCFIFALSRTTVANVPFIQALAPLVSVVLARFFLGERATRRAGVAMGIALIGVVIMVGGPKEGATTGLIAAFGVTILFAGSIVLTRSARDVSMSPASALSQLIVFFVALPFSHFSSLNKPDVIRLLVLGMFQMGLGQLCFVMGARLIAASETALFTLLEVVLAPIWVWLFYQENPGLRTLLGGLIVLAGVVVQATERKSSLTPSVPITTYT